MWRHTEGNNIVILAELLEFERLMALVAVNNKQLVGAYPTLCCILNKVLKPVNTKLICSPAIIT